MAKFGLDEKEMKEKLPTGSGTAKKPRRATVKNASFFLYKTTISSDDLSPMGSFETKADICKAYGKALDGDVFQDNLVGFKSRLLEFTVTEKKRKVAVR